jgi:hypothetical protein
MTEPPEHPAEELTLRDYFAAAALTGLLSDPNRSSDTYSGWAVDAYKFADAMLAERAK